MAAAALFMVGCELSVDEQDYEEKLVVFANLEAGLRMMDTVYVSYTYEINEAHESGDKWVSDADVRITGAGDTLEFLPVESRPGRYTTSSVEVIVPGEEYTLNVEHDDESVSASTTVPDLFTVTSVSSDLYECDGEPVFVDTIDLHLEENSLPVILGAMMSGDYSSLAMDTVIYREGPCHTTSFASVPLFLIDWEAEEEPGMMRVISFALEDTTANAIVDTSFAANAFKGSMWEDENGNYYRPNPAVVNLSQDVIDFSWLLFNYYSPHLIFMQTTDHAFSDYFFGDPFRQNQWILPDSNIDGGYGLFSSVASRYFVVYVAPDTEP
jgi:hypothetical protein